MRAHDDQDHDRPIHTDRDDWDQRGLEVARPPVERPPLPPRPSSDDED